MRRLDPALVRRLMVGLINQVVHEREDLRGVPTHEGNEPEAVSEARAFLAEFQAADRSPEAGIRDLAEQALQFEDRTKLANTDPYQKFTP